MGNKTDPQAIDLAAGVPLMIVDGTQPHTAVFIKNGAEAIGLHRRDVGDDIDDYFPLAANETWNDSLSGDSYWAVCDSNTTIYVWVVQ